MSLAAMRVPTVFTAVDRFSKVVNKMTMSTSAFGKSAEAAAMRTSRRFSDAGTSMLYAGAGMAVGLGLAVNEAMKFEKAISDISTLTKNTPEQMKAIGDSILNTSTKIPIAISDLTTGMYDVVSAGIEGTAYQLEVLNRSGKLAVAGLGTTKEAVNITTSALNAFGKEAGTAYQVTNLLMKAVKYGKTTVSGISESFGSFAAIMKNSGVGLQEYLASTTALTTAGMTMSRAQTQVSSATIALIKPNNQMLKIYKRLGVKDVPAFIKANGGLVNTLEIVGKTGKGMGLMLSKVFGRKEGLSAYLSLLGALKPKFNQIMTDMASGSDMVNEAFTKQSKTFSAQFQIMKNKTIALGIAIGNELMPRIIGFMNTISPMVSGLIGWIKRNEWLATTLLNLTVRLLALGALAKIGAILFFGLSKAIAITSAITKTYTFISTLAALSNVGLGTATLSATGAMWKFVAAELAALSPIALVIGALGILAIAYKMVSDATKKTMFTVVDSYKKGDASIKYSTIVMQSEFDKQYNAMVAQRNRVDAFNGKAINVGNIGLQKNGYYNLGTYSYAKGLKDSKTPFLDEANRRGMNNKFSQLSSYSSILPNSSNENSNLAQPKNLAGKSDTKYSLPHIGGELKITVETQDGSKAKVDSSQVYGIKVNTPSTMGVKN